MSLGRPNPRPPFPNPPRTAFAIHSAGLPRAQLVVGGSPGVRVLEGLSAAAPNFRRYGSPGGVALAGLCVGTRAVIKQAMLLASSVCFGRAACQHHLHRTGGGHVQQFGARAVALGQGHSARQAFCGSQSCSKPVSMVRLLLQSYDKTDSACQGSGLFGCFLLGRNAARRSGKATAVGKLAGGSKREMRPRPTLPPEGNFSGSGALMRYMQAPSEGPYQNGGATSQTRAATRRIPC